MKNSLRSEWFKDKKIYLLVFFIPVILMFLIYAFFGVHPFGQESVLVLDLNGQYVSYFEYLRDAVWGNKSLMYSWSRNLSGEFFGIYGYYLASPFSLIPVIFPRSMMMYSLEIMELAKIGSCAVTFAFYMRNRKESKPFTLLIFSTTYALMGYTIVEIMNPMWIDGLVYLPLIVYGTELLVDKGRKMHLIIPLALMFIANFYIGYMIGIFTAFYFVYYYFYTEERQNAKETLKTIGRFALSAVVAIICSLFIIIPVYKSLQLGKLDFSNPSYTLEPQFTIFDFLAKLMPFSYDTVRPEGLPVIYCGVMTVMLVPLYFLNKNIKTRHKIANASILCLLFVSMYLSTVDLAWHGFQVPNWLPYRYSFLFSFMLIVMAAQAFEHLEGITAKEIGGTFGGILVFIIYMESQRKDNINPFGAIFVSIVCICIYLGILKSIKRRDSKSIQIVTLTVVCCELFITGLMTVIDIDNDVVYSKYSSYKPYIEQGREVADWINSQDTTLFRDEKTFHRTTNDNLSMGLKGISHSSSTMNTPVISMIDSLGFASRGHYTKYKGATPITDAFFGIKYIMNKDASNSTYHDDTGYEKVYVDKGISVYKNPNALSIGFMANNAVREVSFSGNNPFMNQNMLFSALTSENASAYFNRIYVENADYYCCNTSYVGSHTKYTPSKTNTKASVTFTITAPDDKMIYAYFPTSYERKVDLYVNEVSKGTYFETDNYTIVSIGRFSEGEQINVKMVLQKDEAFMQDQYFFNFNEDLFNDAMSVLKKNEWNITKHTDTYLSGDITAEDNQVMLTTIPYEPGWNITVDGEKTEPVKIFDCLIGIELTPGTHTVTMRFLPSYYIIGLIISGCGVIIVVVLGLLERRSKKLLLNRLYTKE